MKILIQYANKNRIKRVERFIGFTFATQNQFVHFIYFSQVK